MSDPVDDIFSNVSARDTKAPTARRRTAGDAASHGVVGQSPTRGLHDWLALFLVLQLGVAVIPYGSNRPFFWAFWAAVTCALMLAYEISLTRLQGKPRRPVSLYPAIVTMFLLVSAWMLIQVLPFGRLFGGIEFATQTRTFLTSPTLSLAWGESVLALLKWVTYGLMFYLALQVSARNSRARKISYALMFLVTAEALYSIAALLIFDDALLLTEKHQYIGDATGTFINRNSFATFLSMGAALAAALAIPSSNQANADPEGVSARWTFKLQNLLSLTCLIVILSALFATNSRMGVFSGLCGILLVILLRLPTSKLRVVAGAILVAGAGLVFLVYGEDLFNRLLFIEKGADTRLDLYKQVLEMIADRPLLGFGADTFRLAYPLYQSPPVASTLVFDKAHSTYLAHWSELGLIFGTLPLIIIAACAWTLVRYILRSGPRSVEISTALGAILIIALHSLVDFSMEIQAVVFLFILLLAQGMSQALFGPAATGPR